MTRHQESESHAARHARLVYAPRLFVISTLGFAVATIATIAWIYQLRTGGLAGWMTPAAAFVIAIVGLSSTAGLAVTLMQTWRDRALALGPLLLGVVLLWGPSVDQATGAGLLPHDPETCPVADFELQSIDGTDVRLSDLRGRVVLVDVWRTWCGPCIQEFPMLSYAQRLLGNDGLVVLGLSDESIELQRPFSERYGLSYPLLVDDGSLPHPFRSVNSFPTTFLIDREGCLETGHVRGIDGLRRLIEETRNRADEPFPSLAVRDDGESADDGT